MKPILLAWNYYLAQIETSLKPVLCWFSHILNTSLLLSANVTNFVSLKPLFSTGCIETGLKPVVCWFSPFTCYLASSCTCKWSTDNSKKGWWNEKAADTERDKQTGKYKQVVDACVTLCVWMCVCVRERTRERECVRVCVCACKVCLWVYSMIMCV